jgi:hypothetical protein
MELEITLFLLKCKEYIHTNISETFLTTEISANMKLKKNNISKLQKNLCSFFEDLSGRQGIIQGH